MTVEYISWSNLHERMLLPRRWSHPQPPERIQLHHQGQLKRCVYLNTMDKHKNNGFYIYKYMYILKSIYFISRLLIQIHILNDKQWRSRSVGPQDKPGFSRTWFMPWKQWGLKNLSSLGFTFTVDSRYLDIAYLELPLISKWKFGP